MWWRQTARFWHELGERNPFGVILTGADRRPRDWDVDAFFATGVDDVEGVVAELRAIAPALPRRAALDFGCGVGRISRALASHFESVVGLDVAPSMIAAAQRLNAAFPRCTFRVNRSSRLRGMADGRFDFVYSRLVLQHIPPRSAERYIAEMVRVLAPGGVLMFQLPEPLERDSGRLFTEEERAFVDAPIADTPLKRLLPRWLIRLYRHVRFRRIVKPHTRPPRMHMFGVERVRVLELLGEADARVIRVDVDASHGADVSGYVYWVTKGAAR